MKTTIYLMNDAERAERARVKDLHARCRAGMDATNPQRERLSEPRRSAAIAAKGAATKRIGTERAWILVYDHRSWLLAWAFVRGIPYRRVERQRHMQGAFEHNAPSVFWLANALAELGLVPRKRASSSSAGSPTPREPSRRPRRGSRSPT